MTVRMGNAIIAGSNDIDDNSITTNNLNKIQATGVIDQNSGLTAIKSWVGTLAEYNALSNAGLIDDNTLYNITDDYETVIPGGLEIGDIGICALGIDETQNKRRYLNGQVINQAQFVAFTNKLKSIVALYPNLETDEVNWQTEVTNSKLGQCGKFVIDDDAGTIRLPKVVNINGLQNLTGLGGIKAESLPNITGSYTATGTAFNSDNRYDGAFIAEAVSGMRYGGLSSANDASKLSINASLSSSTYQDDAPVQQEAVQYPYFIQVAEGVETSVDVSREIELTNPFTLFQYQWSSFILNNASWLRADTFSWQSGAVYVSAYEQLLTEYNAGTSETAEGITYRLTSTGKKIALPDQETAITSLYASTGKAWYYILDTENEQFKLPRGLHGTVVQSYKDGANWYRVYSDGWCEQGGTTSSGSWTEVTFLKTYADTNYTIIAGTTDPNTDATTCSCAINNKTASSFYIGNYYNGTAYGYSMWYACGYISGDFNDMEKYLYFYVGETVQDANLINTGAILGQLNNKVDINFNNITNTGKENAIDWMLPDYSAGISVSSGYIAVSDGWIKNKYIISNGTFNLNINGITIYNWTTGGAWYAVDQGLHPVKKGDVILFNGTGIFYPCKGVN